MTDIVRAVARALLAGIFLSGGARAAREPEAHAAQAEEAPVPNPTWLVRVDGVAKVVGAGLLASGLRPRLGALLMAASLVPTTIAGHAFWLQDDDQQRSQQQIHFFKNVGLLGGLLLVLVDHPAD